MSLDIKVFFQYIILKAFSWNTTCAFQILEIYGMSEISGPQTGNSYDKVRGQKNIGGDVFVQLKPGTIGKDLEGFHSRLDKSAPGAAEVLNPPNPFWEHSLDY